jgi:hypothetical protein
LLNRASISASVNHSFDEGLGKASNLVSMLFEYLMRLLKADLAKARSYWFVEFADEIVDFTHVGYRANEARNVMWPQQD